MHRYVLGLALALCLGATTRLRAQSVGEGDPVITEAVAQQTQTELAARRQKYADNADVKLWPGIVADRQARSVEIDAYGTGLGPTDPIEFWVLTQSDKTYEAYCVTPASPDDLRAAMAWIGMPEGRPVDFEKLWFWPRGERVDAAFIVRRAAAADPVTVPAHLVIHDDRRDGPMAAEGWVYTASQAQTFDGEETLMATATGYVASTYNTPFSLFDVPHRAVQEVVYGSRTTAREHLLAFGQRVTVRLTPQLQRPGQSRIQDWALSIDAPKGTASKPQELTYRVSISVPDYVEAKGPSAIADADFDGLLERIRSAYQGGHDLFVTLRYADTAPVSALNQVLAMIATIAERDIIRVEPVPDELYYQAFLPQADWLDAEKRLVHPVEITLTDPATGAGELTKLFDIYPEGQDAYIETHRFAFADSAALQKHIAAREEWETDTIFLIVPDATPVAQIRTWYAPLHERFPTLFIYTRSAVDAATLQRATAAPPAPAPGD